MDKVISWLINELIYSETLGVDHRYPLHNLGMWLWFKRLIPNEEIKLNLFKKHSDYC